ncbi:hypothetical protein G6L37_05725 [Agrobacterium rubi]|nr:hypothetical protein [Agrobacterium rubi]NTF24858.1 hypothetical protein [Agrobacterium rubi]
MEKDAFESFYSAVGRIHEIEAGYVSVILTKHERGAELGAIWSELERGRGHAGRAMRAMIEIADEHGIDIYAQPHFLIYDTAEHEASGLFTDEQIDLMDRLNENRLDNEELLGWYERLGFVSTGRILGDDPEIVRMASAPNPSP